MIGLRWLGIGWLGILDWLDWDFLLFFEVCGLLNFCYGVLG